MRECGMDAMAEGANCRVEEWVEGNKLILRMKREKFVKKDHMNKIEDRRWNTCVKKILVEAKYWNKQEENVWIKGSRDSSALATCLGMLP